jgi:hypothetical protein
MLGARNLDIIRKYYSKQNVFLLRDLFEQTLGDETKDRSFEFQMKNEQKSPEKMVCE